MKSLVVATLALCLFAGCSGSPTSPPLVEDRGTIRYMNLEGGFYGIVGDKGGHYDPVDLPGEMMVDGLRVHFIVQPLPDRVSFHMWGEIVSVQKIQRID